MLNYLKPGQAKTDQKESLFDVEYGFHIFQVLRTRTNLTKDEIPFRDKELDVRVDLKTVQRDTILYKFVRRLYF